MRRGCGVIARNASDEAIRVCRLLNENSTRKPPLAERDDDMKGNLKGMGSIKSVIKLLPHALIFFFLAAAYGFGNINNSPMFPEFFAEQKYDSEEFSLYPSQFVIHSNEGDLSYRVLVKEDEEVLGRVIRILNYVERTQQAEWPSIQRKIALCNGVTCGDTLNLNLREGDSLLVNVYINGEMFDLIAYYPATTPTYIFVWIMSTSSIWGVLLVGIIGFLWSRKKRSNKLEKEIPVYSASRNEEKEV